MATSKTMNSGEAKPDSVLALETAYGPPSQSAWGSAVFYEALPPDADLAESALAKYRYFVGELWERFGEDTWMGSWKEVYRRTSGGKPDIVSELKSITDTDARNSVPMVLDVVENASDARAALANAFDGPSVTELLVFNAGDGGAMSGILIAACRREVGDATYLAFLMD